jgi:hypothetical protein
VPFTLRNLKEDLEDVGSNFDGPSDLEFRMATHALALEQSGLSYQSVPPENRSIAGVALLAASVASGIAENAEVGVLAGPNFDGLPDLELRR